MKQKTNFRMRLKSRSPWKTLRNSVNKLNRIAREKADPSYRDKAEMMQLKTSIDKLKRELKDSQKTILDLTYTNEKLSLKLKDTQQKLTDMVNDLFLSHEHIQEEVKCDK